MTDELRHYALRALIAWDGTVLPKAHDGMMQERMEDLRAALDALPAGEPAAAPASAVQAEPVALKVGDTGWMKVRIDTEVQEGACFATPARHPDDIAKGYGEWDDEAQVFGLVVAAPAVAAPVQPLTDAQRERADALLDGFDSRIETAQMNGDQYDAGYLKAMRAKFCELLAAAGITATPAKDGHG